jgi:hypothetical protein
MAPIPCTTPSNEEQSIDWLVSCSGSILNCKNLQTDFDGLLGVSHSKTHEWCSNDFGKFKINTGQVHHTEPLKKHDTFSMKIAGPFKSKTIVLTQSGDTKEGIVVSVSLRIASSQHVVQRRQWSHRVANTRSISLWWIRKST